MRLEKDTMYGGRTISLRKEWDVTKNNDNKNKKTRGNKKEINNNNKTQRYEQSLENSQNKL